MRILLLAPHPFLQDRGTPLAVRAVVEFLVREGHRVDLLTYHEGEAWSVPGCEVRRIPGPPAVRGIPPGFSFKKLLCDVALLNCSLRLLRERRYDLLHAVEESVFVALHLHRLHGVPYVYDMDSMLSAQLEERWPWLALVRRPMVAAERRAMRGAAGVLTVCKALEERVHELAPGRVVGRVEDTSLLSDDGEAAPVRDVPTDLGTLVMYVGNLKPYQGIDLLLEGFAVAVGRRSDLGLVVIGGAARDIETYRAKARSLGIGARVRFLGPRPIRDLGGYLRRADVLVSPRLKGLNTPMKIYSYMDSGTAVLATDLPTHTQVLGPEVARLVAPTPEGVAEGLADLAERPSLRKRLGQAARERYRLDYGKDAFERKMRRFYDRVAEALAGGGGA